VIAGFGLSESEFSSCLELAKVKSSCSSADWSSVIVEWADADYYEDLEEDSFLVLEGDPLLVLLEDPLPASVAALISSSCILNSSGGTLSMLNFFLLGVV